jgi:SfnB family sulfur acquisition oxidoreductase
MTDATAPVATPSRPQLADADQAIQAAQALSELVRPGSGDRDRDRTPPLAELAEVADSGLLSIFVPRDLGGPQLSRGTVAEVLRRLAVADPAIAQLLLAHFVIQAALWGAATPAQKRFFAGEILDGAQLGNANAERGTKHSFIRRTRAQRDPAGGWRITGSKYYATGALGARWIAIGAVYAENHPVTAFVAPDDEGVTLELDAWSSFGQRATFSGAVSLDEVHVPDERILDAGPLSPHPGPTIFGAYDQIAHLAVDVGIARAALEDGVTFIRDRARPWFEADSDRVADEPHVLRRVGELTTRLHALEALFDRARATLDSTAGAAALTDENTAAASLAVAEAKAFAQEVALEIATGVLEFGGTTATDDEYGLDRHWRNVRTHSLHDPARWKYVHIGNHALNGVRPPRHPRI